MIRDNKFAPGETYHCFTRGVNKQLIFADQNDHLRFLILLLVCNGHDSVHMGNLFIKYQGAASLKYKDILENEVPEKRLVHILAYSLMPNHIHLILQEIDEGGISKFTQRLFTAYSMYFNKKHNRTGPLFERPFKSRHIDNESYFRWIFSYVHLNPVAIVAPKWEVRGISSIVDVRTFMHRYRWSSYYDYTAAKERPEKSILSTEHMPDFLNEIDDLESMLEVYNDDEE